MFQQGIRREWHSHDFAYGRQPREITRRLLDHDALLAYRALSGIKNPIQRWLAYLLIGYRHVDLDNGGGLERIINEKYRIKIVDSQ